jgi:putative DNA primase/helicase
VSKEAQRLTTARIFRALIDPNEAALRSEPKDERDLMIAAKNGWVIAFDNLSRIPPLLSDAICRLATGGGFGTRKLYENDEEVLFDAMRPVILNGIEELVTRSDLLDRAIVLTLAAIHDDKRQTQGELWATFERLRPGLLGALLDAVSCALLNVSRVCLNRSPRMADFAQWATAAESKLGLQDGEFMRAYSGNREIANDLALEASAASSALLALIDQREYWKGTSAELLAELNSLPSNDETKRHRGWPKSPQAMGSILKRIAPNLRAVGIRAERGDGRERRTWILEKRGNCSSPLSRMSPETSLPSSASDIGCAQEPCLSRELSHERDSLNPSDDNGDKRDNHLPEFSEVSQFDDEISERAAIVEFDGRI